MGRWRFSTCISFSCIYVCTSAHVCNTFINKIPCQKGGAGCHGCLHLGPSHVLPSFINHKFMIRDDASLGATSQETGGPRVKWQRVDKRRVMETERWRFEIDTEKSRTKWVVEGEGWAERCRGLDVESLLLRGLWLVQRRILPCIRFTATLPSPHLCLICSQTRGGE